MTNIKIVPVQLDEILPLRSLFLQDANFQVRYDSCHGRGWSDSYQLLLDGVVVGYGSVKGKDELHDRDSVFEFFLLPSFRKQASRFFEQLLSVSKASFIECQTNDSLLSSLIYEFAENISSDTMLFDDDVTTDWKIQGVTFRRRQPDDEVFEGSTQPVGDCVLEKAGEIVATGDFLTHYNEPFADLFMEVKPSARQYGFGTLILQELKRECYLAGRVPSARCNLNNKASRATLLKAGFRNCAFMLAGQVKTE